MSTRTRRLLQLLFAAMIAVVGSVLAPSPALALSQSTPYYVTARQWLVDARTCVYYTFTGTLSWKFTRVSSDGTIDYLLYDQKLVNPRIEVVTRTSCTSSGVRKTMKKATIVQAWWYYSCSTSAAVYAEIPWAVGVQVTPRCGNRRAMRRATTYGAGSYYSQSNSGSPGGWDRTALNRFCVAPIGVATVYYTSTRSVQSKVNARIVCGVMK